LSVVHIRPVDFGWDCCFFQGETKLTSSLKSY